MERQLHQPNLEPTTPRSRWRFVITASALRFRTHLVNTLRGYLPRRTRQMADKKVHTETHHRSSVDGRFVTERYADRNPNTTERERIKYPGK